MNGNIAQYIGNGNNNSSGSNDNPAANYGLSQSLHREQSVRLPSVLRLLLNNNTTSNSSNNNCNNKHNDMQSRRIRVDRVRRDGVLSLELLKQVSSETFGLDPAQLSLSYQIPLEENADQHQQDTLFETSLLLTDADLADALLFLGGGLVQVQVTPQPLEPPFVRLLLKGGEARLVDMERVLNEQYEPSLALLQEQVTLSRNRHPVWKKKKKVRTTMIPKSKQQQRQFKKKMQQQSEDPSHDDESTIDYDDEEDELAKFESSFLDDQEEDEEEDEEPDEVNFAYVRDDGSVFWLATDADFADAISDTRQQLMGISSTSSQPPQLQQQTSQQLPSSAHPQQPHQPLQHQSQSFHMSGMSVHSSDGSPPMNPSTSLVTQGDAHKPAVSSRKEICIHAVSSQEQWNQLLQGRHNHRPHNTNSSSNSNASIPNSNAWFELNNQTARHRNGSTVSNSSQTIHDLILGAPERSYADMERLQKLEKRFQEQERYMKLQSDQMNLFKDQLREQGEAQSAHVQSELQETARLAAEEINDERLEELEQEVVDVKNKATILGKQIAKQETFMVERLDELKTLLVDASQQDRVQEVEEAIVKQKTQVNELVMSFVKRLQQLESSMAELKMNAPVLASSSSSSESASPATESARPLSPVPPGRTSSKLIKRNKLVLTPDHATLTGVGCEMVTTQSTPAVEFRAINNVARWDLQQVLEPGKYRGILPVCRGDPGGASCHMGIRVVNGPMPTATQLRSVLPLVQFTPTADWKTYTKVTSELEMDIKGVPGETLFVVSGGWYCDLRAVSLEYVGPLESDAEEKKQEATESKSIDFQLDAIPPRPVTSSNPTNNNNVVSQRTTSPSRRSANSTHPTREFTSPRRDRSRNKNTLDAMSEHSRTLPPVPTISKDPGRESGRGYNSPLRVRSADGEVHNRPLSDYPPPRNSASPLKGRPRSMSSDGSSPMRRPTGEHDVGIDVDVPPRAQPKRLSMEMLKPTMVPKKERMLETASLANSKQDSGNSFASFGSFGSFENSLNSSFDSNY